jgi:hypothetical protein
LLKKTKCPSDRQTGASPYGLEDEGTDIEVALPDDPGDVPADADADDTQFGRGFGQVDPLPLLEIDGHMAVLCAE